MTSDPYCGNRDGQPECDPYEPRDVGALRQVYGVLSSGTVREDPADTGKEQEPAEGTGSHSLDLRAPVAQDQEDKYATYSH